MVTFRCQVKARGHWWALTSSLFRSRACASSRCLLDVRSHSYQADSVVFVTFYWSIAHVQSSKGRRSSLALVKILGHICFSKLSLKVSNGTFKLSILMLIRAEEGIYRARTAGLNTRIRPLCYARASPTPSLTFEQSLRPDWKKLEREESSQALLWCSIWQGDQQVYRDFYHPLQ